MKRDRSERGEASNSSQPPLIVHQRDPTEFIKPGARTHEPGTREITDAPRSPRSFSLSLPFFLSSLSLSVPRDRFHGEHFQLSIVRTSLDNPLWDPSLGYLRFWSPLSAASLGPTDSRRLPRQRDWNLFIALADRHSRTLIGGSNRGTPWRRDGATRWRVQRGGGEQRKGEHANSAGCNYSDLWRRDDGEKCRRPPVPSLGNYRWWLATTFDKAFVLLPPDSASLANVQWRFHSLEWVVERFFPCFISIYHPEERGAGMIEHLDPSWIDWKRANGKGFRNDSSLMIDERRR